MKSLETAKTCSLWACDAVMDILPWFLLFFILLNLLSLVFLWFRLEFLHTRSVRKILAIKCNNTQKYLIKTPFLRWKKTSNYTHNFSWLKITMFFLSIPRVQSKSAAFRRWWSTKKNSLWTSKIHNDISRAVMWLTKSTQFVETKFDSCQLSYEKRKHRVVIWSGRCAFLMECTRFLWKYNVK